MAPTPDRVPEGWDAASSWYERAIAPFTAKYAEDLLRLASVRKGERVLDVAAGTGALSFLAASRGARVLATDFAKAMIERLDTRIKKERVAGIETRVMDGQNLTLPDATFDVTASAFGLIFFPDRARGLAEMRRVLKPQGRVALATWSAPDRVRIVGVIAEAVRTALPDLPPPSEPPAIFSMSDRARIESEMAAAGFADIRIESVSHDWVLPTVESLWTDFAPSSPVFVGMLAALSPEKKDRVRDALLERGRAEFKDGPVRLPSEAHLVVATRP